MNINSTSLPNYYTQVQQNNSEVQSQSSASGMSPSSSEVNYDSIMQLANTQLMTMLDTNQDGSIDKTEFSDATKQLSQSTQTSNTNNAFKSIDSNADGLISSNELLDSLKHLSSQQKAHKKAEHMQHSENTQIPVDEKSKDLQSILMKQILSAYKSSNISSYDGLSIKA